MGIKIQIDGPGYWIKENVFSVDECDYLVQAQSILSRRGRAGARHVMSNPAVAALATDQRLLEIARRSLGGEAVPYRATLFDKSIDAKWLVVWHQDRALPLEPVFDAPGWGPWSRKAGITYAHAPTYALSRIVSLRVHLDASMSDNGPLKIVPESHWMGVMSEEEVLAFAATRPYVECLVGRGGGVGDATIVDTLVVQRAE
jgi:ectoine hydroxylase-related dioxygenase (phytanoyl-CoA dioxygenase family)